MRRDKISSEIYIHIPFCVKKCNYCDFNSFPASEDMKEKYVERLIWEIRTRNWDVMPDIITSIFIGGGTPTTLSTHAMSRILDSVYATFPVAEDAEITIEANPGTCDFDAFVELREMGINRLSIGMQSTNEDELRLLGRIHTYKDFLEAYDNARIAGFENINIDVMNALPYQSKESYEKTLRRVTKLHPEHISAYSLIIEPGTKFYEQFAKDEKKREKGERPSALPTEEMEREMDRMTKRILRDAGYERYEISNYALPGYECKHNVGYWTRANYLGFGISSASLLENVRYQNGPDIKSYIENGPQIERNELTKQEAMEEFIFLGLRMDRGISKHEYFATFREHFETRYRQVADSLIEKKLIKETEDRIYLTEWGRDISNYVLAQFLQ